MIPQGWLLEARQILADHITVTPVTYDPALEVFLKWENRQITGSFKIRGAYNKIASLLPWERELGLVTASAGNHGQGVAYAARDFGAKVVIFASDHAVPTKVDAMRLLGADVRLVPGGYPEAEAAGLSFAQGTGMTWISPYNDGRVIAGQATIGFEICEQIHPFNVESVIVPVGGGGLITGIALALRAKGIHSRIIGVQSEATACMHALYNGRSQDSVVEWESLADGLTGKVEETSITIPVVRELVDDMILVSEDSIKDAIGYAWHEYQEVIEGSAAVTLAAVRSGKVDHLPAVLIISGGNIQPAVHRSLAAKYAMQRGEVDRPV